MMMTEERMKTTEKEKREVFRLVVNVVMMRRIRMTMMRTMKMMMTEELVRLVYVGCHHDHDEEEENDYDEDDNDDEDDI